MNDQINKIINDPVSGKKFCLYNSGSRDGFGLHGVGFLQIKNAQSAVMEWELNMKSTRPDQDVESLL